MNHGNGGGSRNLITLVLLTFIVCYPFEIVISQENPALINFDEALKRAFTGDPGLAARNDQISINEYMVRESVSRFNPRLDVYSTYSRTSLESNIITPINISLFPQDRYNFGISLSHDILSFGKRSSSRDVARARTEISKVDKQEYERSLYDKVARVFLAALLTGRNLEIHKENLARARKKLDIVISRINEGLASDYDSVRAELLLARYQNNAAAARGDFAEARSSLKSLLNLGQEQEIMPVGELRSFECELPARDEIDPNGNTEVVKLGKAIDIQNELIKFHRSTYFPTIGYFAKYDWQNGYQPDVEKLDNFWTAGVSLNMNLFDGGGKKSRISQARYEARKAGNLRTDLITYIQSEIKNAQTEIATARAEIAIAEKRLELAEKGLFIAEARYQEGLLSISDLLDLELEKADAEIGLNAAVYKLAVARLNLKSAADYYPELEKEGPTRDR